jgi:hypothetical protein
MEAKVTASGGGVESQQSATAGTASLVGGGTAASTELSQTRAKESRVSLLIQVRNFSAAPDKATLEWYFVANPVTRGAKNYIFDKGTQEISIGASGTEKVPIQSAALQSATTKEMTVPSGSQSFIPDGTVTRTGATVGGWIVRLMVDGKPYQVRASTSTLEAVGKNDATLNAFPQGGGVPSGTQMRR